MEPHKNLNIGNEFNISPSDDYLTFFDKSFKFVKKYYSEDFDRIASTNFETISPEFFFQEFCWCVCVSGFRASTVSKFFPILMEKFKPISDLIKSDTICDIDILEIKNNALNVFNNIRKIDGMINGGMTVVKKKNYFGWLHYKNNYLNSPDKLTIFPFIGGITKFHLARNIGQLEFVKPDRHIKNLVTVWAFGSPLELCKEIKKKYDLPIGLIDLILWYSASHFGSTIKE